MSRFPRFHGISLAAGAYIENLRAERLGSDPTELAPGRFWYNTTEKALKYTDLDDGGGVVVQVFATGEQIEALSGRIGAIEADYASTSYVESKIAELGTGFNYVGEITPGVDEASALDALTLADTGAGAYYKAAAAGYVKVGSTGTARYVNAKDGVLFNASGTVDVVDNSNSEIGGVADFVEVTGSTDTGFTVDLAAAFKGRVSDLETGLASETQARKDADTALSGRLDAVETLPGQLNAQRFTYQSTAAAVEHLIDHNLNSLFVAVDVWSEGDDGKYRKDIVDIEETSANRVTVRLTESAKIKAVVQVMEPV